MHCSSTTSTVSFPSTTPAGWRRSGTRPPASGSRTPCGSASCSIFGGSPVDAQDRDVRAVHRAAHVHAARHAPRAAWPGRSSRVKCVVQLVHHRLDDARGVGGGRVAVHPALRVDHVGDRVADAAHREARCGESALAARCSPGRQQELDVVPAGEPQVPAAVLVRQVAEPPDRLDAQQPRRAGAHGVQPVARSPPRGTITPGAQDLVVLPLPVVRLDDRRQELLVVRRTDIGLRLVLGHG